MAEVIGTLGGFDVVMADNFKVKLHTEEPTQTFSNSWSDVNANPLADVMVWKDWVKAATVTYSFEDAQQTGALYDALVGNYKAQDFIYGAYQQQQVSWSGINTNAAPLLDEVDKFVEPKKVTEPDYGDLLFPDV